MAVILKGKRLNLRELEESDKESLWQNAKDFEIAKYTTLPHPYSLKDAEDFINISKKRIKKKESFELGIELKKTGKIIGMVGLKNINWKNKQGEIGYWLGKKYWHKKLMKESLGMMLDFGFKKLGLLEIFARVMHPNISSLKLLEKSGFQFKKKKKNAALRYGIVMDELVYSISASEFRQIQLKKKLNYGI